MMQPRKIQRAFTGLVGLAYEPDDKPGVLPPAQPSPPPRLTLVPVRKKRGPKPKGVRALTNAERQAAHRAKVQAESLKQKEDAALQRAVAAVMKEHPDDKGRRLTGTPHRKGASGMQLNVDSIANITDAVDREIEQFGGPNETRPREFHETTTGRREVKPEGVSEFPEVTIGVNGGRLEKPTSGFRVKLDAHQFEAVITGLVDEHFHDLGSAFRCDICGFETNWPRDRGKHIEELHSVLVRATAERRNEQHEELERDGRKAAQRVREHEQIKQRQESVKEGWTKPKLVTGG